VIGSWAGEAQLRERVKALRASLDLGAIVLTRSEDGMSLFDAAGQLDLPPRRARCSTSPAPATP
jgi:bifunctional ADP-heptose synthase (sugar kinase/adenylyltransferase)